MSLSQLQHAIKHYRALLQARIRSAETVLNDAHARTLKIIQPRVNDLYQKIIDKQAAGEDIPLSWLYEANRITTIQRLITEQIDQYAALAKMQLGQLQRFAVALGKKAGLEQLEATVPAGVKWAFGVPDENAILNMIGATQSGPPLADLFAGFGQEAAEKASQALITGITLGENPRTIAPLVSDALDISRQRALVVSQNEMVRAYRGANSESFRANEDVLDGWIWVADLGGSNTCLACIALNGSEHPVDEDMESHIRCECVMSPKTKSWSDILSDAGVDTSGIEDTTVQVQSGSDWFADQSEATQRSILGDARYKMYQDGTPLKDFVKHTSDPKWGKSIGVKPIKELMKAGK